MSAPSIKGIADCTMLIENQWGGLGTGFLVMQKVAEDVGRVFLVTNKHVLNSKESLRHSATHVVLHYNVDLPDGSVIGQSMPFSWDALYYDELWKEHPDKDVDVIAVRAVPFIQHVGNLHFHAIPFELFANEERRKAWDVAICDDVLVFGYPSGWRQGKTSFPLARSGIIATRIGETMEDEVPDANGVPRKRVVRGFLVDGATIHGSSGSPVVLKPTPSRLINGAMAVIQVPPLLLGIIAETKYAPLRTPFGTMQAFADLGLAFDVETIKETLELFS
jgi:hypothetical protein